MKTHRNLKSRVSAAISVIQEEPFRLFFPLGILAGLMGLGVWMFYYAGWYEMFPAIPHSRLMVQGMLGAFMIGFSTTAGPRMLEVNTLTKGELYALGGIWGTMVLAHWGRFYPWADFLFILLFAVWFGVFVRRFKSRLDLPPPGMVLVLGGILSGLAGSFILGFIHFPIPAMQSAALHILGKELLYTCFPLLPIMGTGPFFFGRFGQLKPRQVCPEARQGNRQWRKTALENLLWLALIWSFSAIYIYHPLIGRLGTAGVVIFYGYRWLPLNLPRKTTGTLGRLLQVGCLAIPAGFVLSGIWNQYRMAFAHMWLLGGYALITLCVSSWVYFGHHDRVELGNRPLRGIRWAGGLLLFALATRVSADFMPWIRDSHYLYAAALLMLVLAGWAMALRYYIKAKSSS